MGTYTDDNKYLTTTARAIVNEMQDMNEYPAPFFMAQDEIHGKGKPREDGGSRVQVNVNFSEHTTGQQLSTGYEPISLTATDVGLPGFDDWMLAVQPIVIGPKERQYNQGKHKRVSILEKNTKAAYEAMKRYMHQRIFGHSTGADLYTDLNTLNGFDYTTNTGFLEENAVASQGNTIHGISKSTYASYLGWQNQRYDIAGSFNSSGLLALYTVNSILSSLGKNLKSLRGYISVSGSAHLKRAVGSNERYLSEKEIDAGRMIYLWDGHRLELNRDMPNAGTVTSASDQEWTIAWIDHAFIKLFMQGDHYFKTGEFQNVSGKFGNTWAPISFWGQLIAEYLATSAVLYGGDTW